MLSLRIASTALLTLLAACSGPSIDNPNAFRDEQGRNRQEIYTLDKASIQTADNGYFDITRIVVNDGGRLSSTESRGGVTAVDQNRLALDNIPLVGKLFMPRLRQSDFTESQRAGTVFAGGDTLQVVADTMPPRGAWKRIVLVNRDFAWVFPAPGPVAVPTPPAGPARAVGTAYMRGDGETLLLLVRPSIITDSLF